MAIIFAFSAQHGGGHLPAAEVVLRKLAHVTEYLVLTLLLLRALRRSRCRGRHARRRRRGARLRSSSDEWHQSFVPGRTATPRDVAIDGIGIALAALAATRTRLAGADRVTGAIVFAERAIAPGGDAIWPAALEHLARRFASIRELDIAAVPAREASVAALEAWAGDDVSSWRLELDRFYDDHARVHLRRDPGDRRAARLAARRRRAARRLRPGPARGLGRHARVPRARPAPRRRSCSSPPATATPPASRRSA